MSESTLTKNLHTLIVQMSPVNNRFPRRSSRQLVRHINVRAMPEDAPSPAQRSPNQVCPFVAFISSAFSMTVNGAPYTPLPRCSPFPDSGRSSVTKMGQPGLFVGQL